MHLSSCSYGGLTRPQLRFSQVVRNNPPHPQAQVIALPDEGISYIDKMESPNPSHIEELDLSHNAIRRLNNIVQFTNLRVLDISDNQIQDCTQLVFLKDLASLEGIKVKNNPFLHLPIDMDVLLWLDSKNIDIQFGLEQQLKLKQHRILANELDIMFIVDVSQRISVHLEMMEKYLMYDRREINAGFFLGNADLLKCSDPLTTTKCLQQLRFQVHSVMVTEGLDTLQAQRLLIEMQDARKMEAMQNLDRKVSQINAIRKKNSIIAEKNLSPIKNYELTQVSEDTVKIRYTPCFNDLPKTDKKRRLDFNSEPEPKHETRYYKNLIKLNPVYNLLYSPVCSLKSKEKDLLIDNLSSDLKTLTISIYVREETQIIAEQALLSKLQQQQQRIVELEHLNERLVQELQSKQDTISSCRMDKDILTRLESGLLQKKQEIHQLHTRVGELGEDLRIKQEEVEKADEQQFLAEVIKSNGSKYTKKRIMDVIVRRYQHSKKVKAFSTTRTQSNIGNLLNLSFTELLSFRNFNIKSKHLSSYNQGKVKTEFLRCLLSHSVLSKNRRRLDSITRCTGTTKWFQRFVDSAKRSLGTKMVRQKGRIHYQSKIREKVFRRLQRQWVRCNGRSAEKTIREVTSIYNFKLLARGFEGFIINNSVESDLKKNAQLKLHRAYQEQKLKHQLDMGDLRKQRLQRLCLWGQRIRKQRVQNQFQMVQKVNTMEILFRGKRGRLFLHNLKTHSKLFLGYKSQKLASYLESNRKISWFRNTYGIVHRKTRQQKLVRRNIIKGLLRRRSQIFGFLRSLSIHRKIREEPLVHKQEYQQRQTKLLKLNELLKLEIGGKEEETRLCHNKLSELKFTVTTQDIKYQQLLAVHEGCILQMKNRESQLLQLIWRLEQTRDYNPLSQMKRDNLKKARIFDQVSREHFQRSPYS